MEARLEQRGLKAQDCSRRSFHRQRCLDGSEGFADEFVRPFGCLSGAFEGPLSDCNGFMSGHHLLRGRNRDLNHEDVWKEAV